MESKTPCLSPDCLWMCWPRRANASISEFQLLVTMPNSNVISLVEIESFVLFNQVPFVTSIGLYEILAPLVLGSLRRIGGGVCLLVFRETSQSQQAGVTASTGDASGERVIAAARDAVIDPKFQTDPNDIGFRPLNERGMDGYLFALHGSFGSQIGHGLKSIYELGTAVWVAAVVERVDADEDVVCSQDFGPRQGEGQKNRVASRNVSYGNLISDVFD